MYLYTCSFTGTDIHLHSITHKRTLKGAMSRAKVYFGNKLFRLVSITVLSFDVSMSDSIVSVI